MTMSRQRLVTGLVLAAVAVVLISLGGLALSAAITVIIGFAVHEEFSALSKGNHRPVSWPTWVCAALGAVLVGDTKFDLQGANALGIDCIGVTYGFGTAAELKGCVAVANSVAELEKILG